MKRILLFFTYILVFVTAKAQFTNDDWYEVGNSAYNSELKSIAFISQDTGFAVGTGGAFLKTTDGGNTWTALNIGYNYFFQKIIFLNSTTGYICGNLTNSAGGRILKTTNAGASWQEVFTDTERFMDVFFLNSSLGFATAYGRVYRTKNGGSSWSFSELTNSYDIRSVWFRNADSGFVAANGSVWMTLDTGNTWTNILSQSWQQVLFVSDSKGYLVKTNSLYKTEDKGLSWVATTNTGISSLMGCAFVNDSTGLTWSYIDEPGIIKKTTNSGTTWTTVMNNPAMKVINISIRKTDNTYFACGKGGLIMKSSDGTSWTTLHQGNIPNMINRLCFINDSTLFAVGNGGLLLKSSDRASSWSNINSGVSKDLMGISKISMDTLFVLCNDGSLLKSVDAGNTWQAISTGISAGVTKKGDIVFVNSKIGIIAMDKIYRTNNGGASWTQVYSNQPVYEISAPSQDTMYAATWAKILMSTDAGNTWTSSLSISSIFWGLHFRNTHKGMAAYQNYKVYSTADAGTTWNYTSISGMQLEDVRYFNDTTAYAVGWNGKLYKTINNGTAWTQVNSGTFRHFYEIYFGPDGTGYVLGQDGMMLRRSLVPTHALKFVVENDEGETLSNFSITLNNATYPNGVDSIGGLTAGNYNYIITAWGNEPDTAVINLISDSTIHCTLKKHHTVSFLLQNAWNNAVAGAQIVLGTFGSLNTDATGNATYSNVTKGSNINLSITAGGYLSLINSITISGDTIFDLALSADLLAPVALSAIDVWDLGFTARWQNVAAADSFRLFVSNDNFITYVAGYEGKFVNGNSAIIEDLQPSVNYQYKLTSVNEFGFSDYSNIIQVTTTASINEISAIMLKIYPNPASDHIFIESDDDILECVLINSIGEEIPAEFFKSEDRKMELSTEKINAGIYVIGINTKSSWIMKKIIITK